MTAEEARKLTMENIDTEVIPRLIDYIDRCIVASCNGGNYDVVLELHNYECAIVDTVCSHYRALGYVVTADPYTIYTDIKISWEE
jgi:hypothetical protein